MKFVSANTDIHYKSSVEYSGRERVEATPGGKAYCGGTELLAALIQLSFRRELNFLLLTLTQLSYDRKAYNL